MTAEMPQRVAPADGARVVGFPWTAATNAVTALNDATTLLGTQMETRVPMVATISDWEGSFRDEFDTTRVRLTTVGSDLKETLAGMASSVVSGAEDANTAQQRENDTAVEQTWLTRRVT